jgi:Tfp pilus assembly protein PilF
MLTERLFSQRPSTQAIEFDTQGRRLESLRSFQAAVRFSESADTFVNLGVCLMRLGTAASDRAEKVCALERALTGNCPSERTCDP